jgi:hypothetical protein
VIPTITPSSRARFRLIGVVEIPMLRFAASLPDRPRKKALGRRASIPILNDGSAARCHVQHVGCRLSAREKREAQASSTRSNHAPIRRSKSSRHARRHSRADKRDLGELLRMGGQAADCSAGSGI